MNTVLDRFIQRFKSGDVLITLIVINVAVFVFQNFIDVFLYFLKIPLIKESFIPYLVVPASFSNLATQPWSIFTYMFLHADFFHILFNMLVLYWFGEMFVYYLSPRRLMHTYIFGGLTGALFFILAFNLFPVFEAKLPGSFALGASAAVMAIVAGVATYQPEQIVHLFLIGKVKLKYLALIYLVIDFLSIPNGNAGGHIAHIGGAFYGWIYIFSMKRGSDWSVGFSKIGLLIQALNPFKKRSRLKVKYSKGKPFENQAKKTKNDEEYLAMKAARQKKVDAILDKIAQGGYESLTKEEKEFLFNESKR